MKRNHERPWCTTVQIFDERPRCILVAGDLSEEIAKAVRTTAFQLGMPMMDRRLAADLGLRAVFVDPRHRDHHWLRARCGCPTKPHELEAERAERKRKVELALVQNGGGDA